MLKELFRLIKSLSPAEKRYFKLHNSFQSTETQYSRLFNLLDSQKGYDRKEIKAAVDKLRINNISHVQHYLYNNILRTLRAYHEDSSLDAKLHNLLLEARILLEKGLNEQSFKILHKAKSIAEKYQKINILIEITRQEYINSSELLSSDEFHPDDFEYTLGLLSLLREELFELNRNYQVFKLFREKNRVAKKDSISQFIASVPGAPKALPPTFQTLYRRTYSKALLHQLQSEFDEAHHYFKLLVDLWDKYPPLKKKGTSRYIKTLANYLGSSHTLEQYNLFPDIVARMKKEKAKTFEEEAVIFQNAYYYELLYFINTFQFYAGEQMVKPLQRQLKKYDARIGISRKLSFYFNLTLLFFAIGKYNKALEWLDRIISEDDTPKAKQNIRKFALLMELILHFELKNDRVWTRLLKKFPSSMEHQPGASATETVFIEYMNQLSDIYTEARLQSKDKGEPNLPLDKIQSIFQQLLGAMNTIPERQKKVTGFLELLIWVEAKAKNKDFRQIFKEHKQC